MRVPLARTRCPKLSTTPFNQAFRLLTPIEWAWGGPPGWVGAAHLVPWLFWFPWLVWFLWLVWFPGLLAGGAGLLGGRPLFGRGVVWEAGVVGCWWVGL